MCIFNPHDGVVLYTDNKMSFLIDICYECGEINFENLITGEKMHFLYYSNNFNNDPVIAKMEKYNWGNCKYHLLDEVKILELKKEQFNLFQ